jgi:hypothetical protein
MSMGEMPMDEKEVCLGGSDALLAISSTAEADALEDAMVDEVALDDAPIAAGGMMFVCECKKSKAGSGFGFGFRFRLPRASVFLAEKNLERWLQTRMSEVARSSTRSSILRKASPQGFQPALTRTILSWP